MDPDGRPRRRTSEVELALFKGVEGGRGLGQQLGTQLDHCGRTQTPVS
jgi:hypothetical protein